MRKSILCELCTEVASLYCASDAAFLCSRCDSRVHQANFLVARHVRQALCLNCKGFAGDPISGSGAPALRQICQACSPVEFSDDSDSFSSSVSSTESSAAGPKRISLEHRTVGDEIVKRGISSSVTEMSDEDAYVPARFSLSAKKKKKMRAVSLSVDVKAEAIFLNWCGKLGVNGNLVVPSSSEALGFCLVMLTAFPFRVCMATSLWLGLRFSGDKSLYTCHKLRRLEEVSGVPVNVILAAEAKVARALRVRKARPESEEGWAECSA
ncbi:B-box zinc finger protein 32 [Carya illinoinensis]|uniref:B box-type domain-containing protein n=1 Tax=Carya illinoinensis TaxID=32201 RepID=A0A8T1RKV9_CARIL|nr:B-box zinc finger protein 32 [Carya illinoinensis]KAG6667269.1 hypothetical protein CIPAW_01G090100 [Carya illinoinensis]